MAFERFHKSFVAPPGGINYSLASNLKPELYWSKLNDMQCKDGVVMPTPIYYAQGTPAIAGAKIVKIYSYVQNSTTRHFILASDTKVYTYNASTNALTDITGAAVLTVDYWSMTTFNGVLYMSNELEGMYSWPGTGNIALIAAAPDAHFITIFHEHLIALGDGASDKKAVNWSNEFDTATWVPAATNDAGGFTFTDTDENVCAYILGDILVVYRRNNISMISFIGGDLVYLHRPLIEGAGAINEAAVLVLQGRHIVMGPQFFFEYSGGNTINKEIGAAINPIIYQGMIDPSDTTYVPIVTGQGNGVLRIPEQNSAYWFFDNGDTWMMYHNYDTGVWTSPISISSAEQISAMNVTVSSTIRNFFATDTIVYKVVPEGTGSLSAATDCLAETRDIFLGSGATDDEGEVILFPLGTVFTTESVDLEFNPTDSDPSASATGSIYIGYKNDLSAGYTWVTNALGVIPGILTGPQRLHWPIRVTGRWMKLRFNVTDHSEIYIAGFQFNFFPNGDR